MSNTPASNEIVDALQFLIGSDIPAAHKRVLIEATTQALRMQQAQDVRTAASALHDDTWQQTEEQELSSFLDGKSAKSWQQADETVQRLAARLQRNPKDVRTKATELGFGVSVNYWLAKAAEGAQRA